MEAHALRMLKHELRTPVNHMIGYAELLLEAAIDDGLDEIVREAEQIQADSKSVAAGIESHFAARAGESVEDACLELRTQVGPLLERVIGKAEACSKKFSNPWAKEFQRISVAANKLMAMIRESCSLDGISGGVAGPLVASLP